MDKAYSKSRKWHITKWRKKQWQGIYIRKLQVTISDTQGSACHSDLLCSITSVMQMLKDMKI